MRGGGHPGEETQGWDGQSHRQRRARPLPLAAPAVPRERARGRESLLCVGSARSPRTPQEEGPKKGAQGTSGRSRGHPQGLGHEHPWLCTATAHGHTHSPSRTRAPLDMHIPDTHIPTAVGRAHPALDTHNCWTHALGGYKHPHPLVTHSWGTWTRSRMGHARPWDVGGHEGTGGRRTGTPGTHTPLCNHSSFIDGARAAVVRRRRGDGGRGTRGPWLRRRPVLGSAQHRRRLRVPRCRRLLTYRRLRAPCCRRLLTYRRLRAPCCRRLLPYRRRGRLW